MISTFFFKKNESVDKHRAALIGKELKTTLAGYTYATHLAYKSMANRNQARRQYHKQIKVNISDNSNITRKGVANLPKSSHIAFNVAWYSHICLIHKFLEHVESKIMPNMHGCVQAVQFLRQYLDLHARTKMRWRFPY